MMLVDPQRLNESSHIPVKIFEKPEDMFQVLADRILDLIQRNNTEGKITRIAWPVGPKKQLPILVKETNEKRISWRNTVNFQVDEWLDWTGRKLPPDHPFNLESYLRRELFSKIDPELRPSEDRMIFHDPLHIEKVDKKIDEYEGLDLLLGGFGFTGHIAYNEPPTSRWHEITNEEYCNGRTRIVPSNEETIIMHSHRSTGGNTRLIPIQGITIGMKDILKAKNIILISDGGAWKQTILRILCFHEPTVKYPGTFVQDKTGAEIWVDTKTAACPSPDFIG